MTTIRKKLTNQVQVGNVKIGGSAPIVIQSMTNTDTSDINSTVNQIKILSDSGSEIVRITVNDDASAKAVPFIKEKLLHDGYLVPIVGCFHYNGDYLLNTYPDMAASLDKYRMNPGNVGFGKKRDTNFDSFINAALKHNKPVRIGVNWGSLDKELSTKLMEENANSSNPKSSNEVMREAMVLSAILSAKRAEELGLKKNKIILSAKVSQINDLVAVYRELSSKTDYALHLGLTEAGIGTKGIVATSAALGILLSEGIGDTIRASITPKVGEPRTLEVDICKEVLQTLNLRSFAPMISSCPGCGRTTNTYFQELASEIQNYIKENTKSWNEKFPGSQRLKIAVMGCIVNGPGESKHADIGISLPGTGENPVAPVFVDGKKFKTLRGDNITSEFKEIINDYLISNFSAGK